PQRSPSFPTRRSSDLKPQNVPWAVLDRSATSVSRRLVDEVEATGYFLAPQRIASYDEGRALLRRGNALAVLVIPRDFARDRERRDRKSTRLNSSHLVI